MKISYVANIRIPTEMAHGIQVMKMCEAFAKNGAQIELIVPKRFSISDLGKRDPFEHYKVERIFKIKKIFCLDLTPLNRFLGPISFLTQALSFAFFAFLYLLFSKTNIIYSRDRFSLLFVSFFKKNVILEAHQLHRSLFNSVLNKTKKIVVITNGLKEDLVKRGVDAKKIMIASDGMDLEDFRVSETSEECRKKLNLPQGRKVVLYTGHLYKWKGVETLALSSKFLDSGTLIVIVGGLKWYLTDFVKFIEKNNLGNVLSLGYRYYNVMPYFLKASDCVVLTGTIKYGISEKYTSPMKMFEYMASKRPIVASDLPSFREVLNEKNSVLVESDNPKAMAEGIKNILKNAQLAEKISEQAYKDVQKYTWDNRAKAILDFICAE